MKKYILSAILAVILAALNISSAFAADDKPLMIIRFNKDIVDYEKSLDKVVASALDAKASTFFDVVSIVPETENSKQNKIMTKDSEYLTGQVAENLKLSGVDEKNIRVTYQNSKLVKNNEVHIFVR